MKLDRKLILYISMSLDGYIADSNNSLDFLSVVEEENQDYGYFDFIKTIDTIIIGRKTYDKVLSMGFEYPHTDKEVYIITRNEDYTSSNYKYFNGDLKELVKTLKNKEGAHIYCDGGAEIANELMHHKLIDEYIISIIPVMLGNGVRLFKDNRPPENMKLISSNAYKKGVVQLHYQTI